MFQKGSTPNWSSLIHKIENRTEHMYTLDNGKVINIMNYRRLLHLKFIKRKQDKKNRSAKS